MKTKIIAAISLAAVAVVIIAGVIVVNPFGGASPTAGGEESMHAEGMAALTVSAEAGEESSRSEGMAALGGKPESGEESMHSEGMAALTADADSDAKPYIGVAISETESGAVKVAQVLEHGPSQGVLEAGDLITAVEGETIDGARDLTDAIADAGAGAALALTVERDGAATDLSVNVGEMSGESDSRVSRYSHSRTFDMPKDGFPMKPGADFDADVYRKFGDMDMFEKFGGDVNMLDEADMFEKFGEMNMLDMFEKFGDADALDEFGEMNMLDMFEKFGDADTLEKFGGAGDFGFFSDMMALGEGGGIARVEKSAAGEDGEFRTHRAVLGTVTDADADAGTFTLQPQDGSAAITYAMTEDSKTLIIGSGDLGGLSADGETPTLVVDVDGEVELVAQGEGALGGGLE